jgi:predicted DNA-binding protein
VVGAVGWSGLESAGVAAGPDENRMPTGDSETCSPSDGIGRLVCLQVFAPRALSTCGFAGKTPVVTRGNAYELRNSGIAPVCATRRAKASPTTSTSGTSTTAVGDLFDSPARLLAASGTGRRAGPETAVTSPQWLSSIHDTGLGGGEEGRASGITPALRVLPGILAGVAKVMISLPDELLARLDAQAAEHGSTRSATIRDLAEAALGEREQLLAEQMRALEGHATAHGGDVVRVLKAGRPA